MLEVLDVRMDDECDNEVSKTSVNDMICIDAMQPDTDHSAAGQPVATPYHWLDVQPMHG